MSESKQGMKAVPKRLLKPQESSSKPTLRVIKGADIPHSEPPVTHKPSKGRSIGLQRIGTIVSQSKFKKVVLRREDYPWLKDWEFKMMVDLDI